MTNLLTTAALAIVGTRQADIANHAINTADLGVDMRLARNGTVEGGCGNNHLDFGRASTSSDQINRAAGNDTTRRSGDYTKQAFFGSNTGHNIENIQTGDEFDYHPKLDSPTVAQSVGISMDGSALARVSSATVDPGPVKLSSRTRFRCVTHLAGRFVIGESAMRMCPGVVTLLLLSACATITEGTSQKISVATEPTGATCGFYREGAQIAIIATTPGDTTIKKTNRDIAILCVKPGYQHASLINRSDLAAATFGNILIGGVIGAVIDNSSGASNKYDGSIAITLKPDATDNQPGLVALPVSFSLPDYATNPANVTLSSPPPPPPSQGGIDPQSFRAR